jgi:hypothetical protein
MIEFLRRIKETKKDIDICYASETCNPRSSSEESWEEYHLFNSFAFFGYALWHLRNDNLVYKAIFNLACWIIEREG